MGGCQNYIRVTLGDNGMETTIMGYIGIIGYMGGCQNYCPFLGTLNIRCRIIIGIQKESIILTTTQI